jgi:predicted MFS family arabinose efflux permease
MLIYRTVTGIGEAMQLTVLLAIAANYFVGHRAAAVGAVNFSFALGAIAGPLLGGALLAAYGQWQVPMLVFGLIGFGAMALIAVVVHPLSTDRDAVAALDSDDGAARTLVNRNTILLTIMSLLGGLVIYGYLGLYPTFLREGLGYSPAAAGAVMSLYGLGALTSIAGGWIGDRGSPRVVLGATFAAAGILGYLLFNGSADFYWQATLSCAWGVIVSGVVYVNLAGYHVKAVQRQLASRASGLFVTSLYVSAAFAGYVMGWIANRAGWGDAGTLQISMCSFAASALALGVRSHPKVKVEKWRSGK